MNEQSRKMSGTFHNASVMPTWVLPVNPSPDKDLAMFMSVNPEFNPAIAMNN
jgi:hypothetical protein